MSLGVCLAGLATMSSVTGAPSAQATEPLTTVAVAGRPSGAVISPDGAFAYVSNPGANTIDVIDLATDQFIGSIPMAGGVQTPVLNPSGTRLYATTSTDGYLSVIDTAARAIVGRVKVGRQPGAPVITANGKQIYVANRGSDDVSVVDTGSATVTSTINVGDQPLPPVVGTGSQYSPNANLLFVTNSADGTVMTIDLAKGQVVSTVDAGAAPTAPAVSPFLGVISSDVYVASTTNAKVTAFAQTGGLVRTGRTGRQPTTPVPSADGTRLFIVNTGGESMTVVDAEDETLPVKGTLPLGEAPTDPVLSPNGGILFVPNTGGSSVTIVDTVNQRVRGAYEVGGGPVGLALSADAKTLVVPNSRDGSVSIIDLSVPALPFPPPSAKVTAKTNRATVTWSATNQAGVTGYIVTSLPGSRTCTTTATRCTVTGLTPGNRYRFMVQALNDYGAGAATVTTKVRLPRR